MAQGKYSRHMEHLGKRSVNFLGDENVGPSKDGPWKIRYFSRGPNDSTILVVEKNPQNPAFKVIYRALFRFWVIGLCFGVVFLSDEKQVFP